MAKKSENIDAPEVIAADERRGGFFLQNTRLLGAIGIALILVVGAITYYIVHKAKADERAEIVLARIRPAYDKGDFKTAINGDPTRMFGNEKVAGLKEIVSEWEGTKPGKIAALYLANCYVALGQTKEAREPYETATGASDDVVRAAAHAGLGYVAEASGQFQQAAEEYEKAASGDHLDLNTPAYLLGAARNYERVNKKDEAIKNYRTVATQYAGSPANTEARLALARYNVEL